jgi:hypothetical protein
MAKMDYSKLLGFDMVAKDVTGGVDFKDATVGAKLGAKVGKTVTHNIRPISMRAADAPSAEASEPVMRGLGGRTVTDI